MKQAPGRKSTMIATSFPSVQPQHQLQLQTGPSTYKHIMLKAKRKLRGLTQAGAPAQSRTLYGTAFKQKESTLLHCAKLYKESSAA